VKSLILGFFLKHAPKEEGKYLLPLLDASYVLPGYQGYGPSLYSGYVVELLDKGTEVFHILNPIAKVDSGSGKYIKHLYNSEWCKFFYKEQMEAYRDALKTQGIDRDSRVQINKWVNKTKNSVI